MTYQGGDNFQTTLNLTVATVIKVGPGELISFSVDVAGSGAGTINDSATTGGAAAANVLCSLATTAPPTNYSAHFSNGLVVVPGTGQTITVSWR